MPPEPAVAVDPPTSGAPSAGNPLRFLARVLENPNFSTADHAAFRRMNPRDPGRAALALYRLLFAAGVVDPSQVDTERWALIVHCLALAGGRHDSEISTGKALFQLNLSEARLNQLLAADSDVLFDVLPLLARRIGAQGAALDWRPLAELARWAGRKEASADKARLQIAQRYAQAQSREA